LRTERGEHRARAGTPRGDGAFIEGRGLPSNAVTIRDNDNPGTRKVADGRGALAATDPFHAARRALTDSERGLDRVERTIARRGGAIVDRAFNALTGTRAPRTAAAFII